MPKAPEISERVPSKAASAIHEIARGMELKKCRRCGCMNDALIQAVRAFDNSEESEIRSLLPLVSGFRARMEPLAYDCIGCKKCWGADATIELANHFEDVEIDSCANDNEVDSKVAAPSANKCACSPINSWPPHPGDYVLGSPDGTVAICTLSNRDLPRQLIAEPAVAIAGRCDTENIGIEKVVLNLLANPRIRWLVICGQEAKGHRAGDAFLRLKERGVNPDMRVLESASWRPILKNLTLLDVARFREQIEEVNLIGISDLDRILAAVRDCASRPLPALSEAESTCCGDGLSEVEHIQAKAPKRLQLDRAGFFIVLPQAQKGLIVCEHYDNSGRLSHVIEGRQAALIAATALERGWVTQLDHAAYLGRELSKAEMALSIGIPYEQDAALGKLAASEKWAEPQKTKACECSDTATCAP